MRIANVLSVSLLCVCASFAPAQEKAKKSGYAPKPVPLGYPLTAVPLNEVKLDEGFWKKRMKTHTQVTIPHVLKALGIDYANPKPVDPPSRWSGRSKARPTA